MIVDRRVFVAGTALAAIAPALRIFPVKAALLEPTAIEQPTLMISGWSEDVGSIDNQVWLRVGLGWRTAWR
jgi:hypothetical protein